MQDFEKLGVFYLGKEYDLKQGRLQEEPVLYKSRDLTTHAVIIGMTGSGKTGLGIGIIEEAALDNIPVIAIDPKGDLGNLALTFPKLRGEDFRPWINLNEAVNKGVTADEYAGSQAEMWRKGLADWGQDGKRIQNFRDAADVAVYTPGGSAGIGVSVLQTFKAPTLEIQNDKEAYRDRIHVTATSLMSLIGLNDDVFTSREYVLVANILEHAWNSGRDISLTDLITAIQTPPVNQIGVMDIESFYPAKDRFSLAMMFNNLLASPGFKSWLEGEPLDINRFLYNEAGKPRISVFSIAHLSDSERMFFVTMLLNEVLSWIRSQPGTGSLRAILYMDELFGYLPPVANPPSKRPLLTLLKQARAYGLGLVLSTQNPVDLDYKALSNAGTWFIGRLQTQRDKERLLAGLEGAAAGGDFDRRRTEEILAGLGQRLFYLHSVHENEAVIFSTRWVLSYLAGPLTRDQISALPGKDTQAAGADYTGAGNSETLKHVAGNIISTGADDLNPAPPVLAPQIRQVYLPANGGDNSNNDKRKLVYVPSVIAVADVLFNSVKHKVAVSKSYTFLAPLHDGQVALDWGEARETGLDLRDLDSKPAGVAGMGVSYAKLPGAAANARSYDVWSRLFNQFIRTDIELTLLSSPTLKVVSEIGEDERNFRIRLQHLAHEHRDGALEALRKKYASKIDILEDRQRRARQTLEKQSALASQKKMDAAVSAGTAILGALFGRRRIGTTSFSRIGTAVRSTSRAMQSGEGIRQAQETLQSVKAQLDELQSELEKQAVKISDNYNMMEEKLEEVKIRAISGNITVHLVALAWEPRVVGEG